jgi:UDP-N-acetylglucosamine--N-acetylmuramyl-(pentapeptide) pyrophosphoryl-undecaprenol N-acetylglucosamine transferase
VIGEAVSITSPAGRAGAAARPGHAGGQRVLAAASSGGHFKQLVSLVPRIPDVGEVTWLTYDAGPTRTLLEAAGRSDDRLAFAPYAAPRDLANLARDARVARSLLREERYDLAISTGAGIAVATLPLARAMGVRAVFVESATRAQGPSLSGRILERCPGLDLCAQHPGYGTRWREVGSVHDGFEPGPARSPARIERVVVTLGTIRPYGFRRLLERLVAVLPADAEVLWQTGATDTTGLPIEGRPTLPGPELVAAMAAADVVVAHAGTGTALTAFELGRCPVLVPRRAAAGEHVDDHQVVTAETLASYGLAVATEVEELTLDVLHTAASRTVVRREDLPALGL